MAVKKAPKIIGLVLGAAALLGGLNYVANHSSLTIGKILTPSKANLPDVKDAQIQNVTPIAYPTSVPASVSAPLIRAEHWEWNAQMGLLLSNGGANTTKGSLQEKHGVNLQLIRQDNTDVMGTDLIACAKEIAGGASQCSSGANFVIIMGDGAGNFSASLNPQLLKLGPDYGLKIIGSVGYSRGEDAFMAPPSFKANPQSIAETAMSSIDGTPVATTGLLVAGVLRDGDWNIALKYAGDNNLPNNPDISTFDKGAINWASAPDYIVAATNYIEGKCENRKEVSNGKLTGKTVHVCINGVVTWTPGDVMVTEKRGGLVKVVSSKEYRSQMPSVIIGPAHFFNQNRVEVQNMLLAAFEGADQVKAFDGALHKAAEISAKVYGDEGGNDSTGKPYTHGAYWYKYFKPVIENDSQGNKVSLGGSAVNNLADNKILFGMDPGTNDNMRSTYTVFATIDKQQYPNLFKDGGSTPIPDIKAIEDKSFLTGIILTMSNGDDQPGAAADTVNYAKVNTGEVISHRSYNINFATGSATPLPEGVRTLEDLKNSIALTGLKVKVDGYTDNSGSAQINTDLSEARAQAVKNWLQAKAHSNFPDNRFSSVEGHGPENPIAPNTTETGKASNRRVEITLTN